MEKIEGKFKHDKLGLELDIYKHEGKDWFLGTDVAKFFGFSDTAHMTRMISDLDNHSCLHNMETVQGNSYKATMIDEYALYEITIKIRNTDAERYQKAKEFRDWVFGEVLPELRKNKGYLVIDENDTVESILFKIIRMAQSAKERYHRMTQKLADVTRERDELVEENSENKAERENLEAMIQATEAQLVEAEKESDKYKKLAANGLRAEVENYCIMNHIEIPNDPIKFAQLAKKVLPDTIPVSEYLIN